MKTLIAVLALSVCAFTQTTVQTPTTSRNNNWTGANTWNGSTTLNGNVTSSGTNSWTGTNTFANANGSVSVVAYGAVCDGNTTTHTGTDNTTAVQNAINAAAAAYDRVTFANCPALVTQTLSLPANTILDLSNTTLILKAGTNGPLLTNANRVFSPTTKVDHDITLIGGVLDGNGSNQADVMADGATFVQGAIFVGVSRLTILGTQMNNFRRYGWWVIYNNDFSGMNLRCVATNVSSNEACIQFNGPTTNAWMNSVQCTGCNDDLVAFNADDLPMSATYTQARLSGTMRNLYVGEIYSSSTTNSLRVLAAASTISGLTVGNIQGDCTHYALNLGNNGLGTGGRFEGVNIGSIECNYATDGAFPVMVLLDTGQTGTGTANDIHIGSIVRNETANSTGQTVQVNTSTGGGGGTSSIRIGNITEVGSHNTATMLINNANALSTVTVDAASRVLSATSGVNFLSMTGGTLGRFTLGPVTADVGGIWGTFVNVNAATINTYDYAAAALSQPALSPVTLTGGAVLVNTIGPRDTKLVAVGTATYTVGATDTIISLNPPSTATITLPAAASFPGRKIEFRNTSVFAINSASSNVGQIGGGAPTSAILPASNQTWTQLQSDGATWVTTKTNVLPTVGVAVGVSTATFTLGGTTVVGTGATVACQNVCDQFSGVFKITTGTTVTASGVVGTVNFPITRANKPSCALSLINDASGAVPTVAENYGGSTTSALNVFSATVLASSNAHYLSYVCGGI